MPLSGPMPLKPVCSSTNCTATIFISSFLPLLKAHLSAFSFPFHATPLSTANPRIAMNSFLLPSIFSDLLGTS